MIASDPMWDAHNRKYTDAGIKSLKLFHLSFTRFIREIKIKN